MASNNHKPTRRVLVRINYDPPLPSPAALLPFAQALAGERGISVSGGEQGGARDNLLRDALTLWRETHWIIAEAEQFGFDVATEKDTKERIAKEAIWRDAHRPPGEKANYTFAEALREVTGLERLPQATGRFQQWLGAEGADVAEALAIWEKGVAASAVRSAKRAYREWWGKELGKTRAEVAKKKGTVKKARRRKKRS
jgi:hypothetical protein